MAAISTTFLYAEQLSLGCEIIGNAGQDLSRWRS